MATRQTWLVIDQGGHSSRAVVFDQAARVMAIESVAISTRRDSGERVEHDPEALLDSITQSIQAVMLAPAISSVEINCVGLATQRSSIVCWDKLTGAALSPVISWQDRRTAETIAAYSDHAKAIHHYTGLVLSPHYGATKLKWCLDNISAVRQAQLNDRLACGPLSSFILSRLLAEKPFVVDPANASRTLLWNYRSSNWEPQLLKLFGVPAEILPECVPSQYQYGHIMVGGERIPVKVVSGDQSAALYAFGEPCADTIYINIGTGAFLQRPVGDQPVQTRQLLGSVVWQTADTIQFVLEGTVNGAGSALQQFAQSAGIDEAELPEHIATGLAEVTNPPLFLNGVSGLGSPFWDADFPSRFIGNGSQEEKLVAVIESIAFLINANILAMTRLTGTAKRLVVTGGLSAVVGLCQRLADLSGIKVERPTIREATAHGLMYLLSGKSDQNNAVISFLPDTNERLQLRYQQWLQLVNGRQKK